MMDLSRPVTRHSSSTHPGLSQRRRRRAGTFGAALLLALILPACNFYNPDYYNPLDPALDAPIEDVINRVQNANLRQAIIDTGATTKFEVEFVNVFAVPVDTLEGIQFFSRIRSLELNNVDLVALGTDLTVLRDLPELEFLNLMNNGYTDANLNLIPFIGQLDGLALGFNNGITDANSLVPIIQAYGPDFFIGFQSTEIGGDTLSALTPVLDQLRGIHAASLAGPTPMTDLNWLTTNNTIDFIAVSNNPITDYSGLSQLSELRTLEIRSWNRANFSVLPTIPNLETLIAENGTATFTSLNGLPSGLREFSIENSNSVVNFGALANSQSTLERIDISGTSVVGPGLPAEVLNLANLTDLRAGDLPNLTTIQGVSALSNLVSLQLFNNINLVNGISEAGQLPQLSFLDFSGGNNAVTTILDTIQANNPDLTIIYP